MMDRINSSPGRHLTAFTCLELLACLTALALLTAIVLPVLAKSALRGDRVACFNNLRQIGNAFMQFGLEHDGRPPWRLGRSQDGNNNSLTEPNRMAEPPDALENLKHNLWYQYWWLRDSIKTPTVLMDPAETRPSAYVASSWGSSTNSWDANRKAVWGLGDNAVAYVLGLDSYSFLPRSPLVLDRNIVENGIGGCSVGISRAANLLPADRVYWRNEIHGPVGNVYFADGSVDALKTEALRRSLSRAQEMHVMKGTW